MALPKAPEARQFWQAAQQRLRDAEVLRENGRTTGAVYLAGYVVEGVLKALLLESCPKRKRQDMLDSFRTAKAHDFTWLRGRSFRAGGLILPQPVVRLFGVVDFWTTKIRYQATALSERKAESFLGATREIFEWAEGRF